MDDGYRLGGGEGEEKMKKLKEKKQKNTFLLYLLKKRMLELLELCTHTLVLYEGTKVLYILVPSTKVSIYYAIHVTK